MSLSTTPFLLFCLTFLGHGRRVWPQFKQNQSYSAEGAVKAAANSSQGLTPAAAFNPGLSSGIGNKHQKPSIPTVLTPIGIPSSATSKRALSVRQFRHHSRKRVGQPQMIFEKFTESAMSVIMMAQEESRRMGIGYVSPPMLLLGLLAQKSANFRAADVLAKAGAELKQMRAVVEGRWGEPSDSTGPDSREPNIPEQMPFTESAKRVLKICLQEQRNLECNVVDTSIILLALLKEEEDGEAQWVLNEMNVSPEKVLEDVLKGIKEDDEEASLEGVAASGFAGQGDSKGSATMLANFTQDLTKKAAEGKLDPIIGRGPEIERTIQILARRKKNNPVLIGDPGVGKTAIAEGLASKIHEDGEDLPDFLRGKRILSLDVTGLMAGTKHRGDFEERMHKIIKEAVDRKGEIILMIDEIHTLVGLGDAGGGGMDAGNMLKPMLANGDLQLIGATTINEYRQFIEKDKALERRFQTVNVPEPTLDEAVQILHGVAKKYEAHHGLRYTPEALEACVQLADQYIADRYLPDKAIDLLDEAGAQVKLQKGNPVLHYSLETRATIDEIQEFDQKINKAAQDRDFQTAGELQRQLDLLKQKLESERNSKPTAIENIFVEGCDIERIVEEMTGIKVQKASDDESVRLMKLEQTLHQRVIGQQEAVAAVAKAVRRSRSGLKDPKRPIASFIFCGPTGVGKTELCKALTESYYGRKDSVLRFDMSEFMESHSVAKLIGSPPGYVGYDEASQLCDRIRRNPYSLVLFDEIEKAHPDVFNIMLQILEDGILTDSKGRTVSFKNALIIMTSNVGAQGIQKTIVGGGGFGFQAPDEDAGEVSYNNLKSKVMDQLKNNFKPEFINRLDDAIVFQPLTKEDLGQIAELEFQKVNERMAQQGVTLEMTEAFKQKVLDEGFDPIFGARPLRRAIGKWLEDELANSILEKPAIEGETAVIDLDSDGKVKVLRGIGANQEQNAASHESFNDWFDGQISNS